jgi:hypothetical protein
MQNSSETTLPSRLPPQAAPSPIAVWMDAEGIIRAQCRHNCDINFEDARESIRKIGAAGAGTPRPTLVDLSGARSMDREARKYFAGAETAKVESAAALLVTSPLARAIGNFFMGMNKTLTPARLFTSEADALAWLRGFLP